MAVTDAERLRDMCVELERHLLEIGADKCKLLSDKSQMSAVLMLVLRCCSLYQSMVNLLAKDDLDAFDCVRRGYLETWLLAFEFRLADSAPKAARWLQQQAGSWSADIRKLEEYARARGKGTPALGRNYGDMSEVAHPTRTAAENSVSLTTNRLGLSSETSSVARARGAFESEMPELLYRMLWLVLDEDKAFIKLYLEDPKVPSCAKFALRHIELQE